MTTPDFNAVVLPPLPAPRAMAPMYGQTDVLAFGPDQIKAYATAAVLADRERRATAAPSDGAMRGDE